MGYWIFVIILSVAAICLAWVYSSNYVEEKLKGTEEKKPREGEFSVNLGQLQDGRVIYIPMVCRREYRPGNPEIGTIGHSCYYNDYLRPWDFDYIKKCKCAEIYNDRQGKPFFASGTEAGALEIIEIVMSKTLQ